ncbi:MAG: hypothetical protein GY787_14940 [Alteromonadales bacterium]|nr:hypothetical protein [Alteromonadales bacterium]
MSFISVSPDIEIASFNGTIFVGALISIIFFIVRLFQKKTVFTASLQTALLFCMFSYLAYSHLNRFNSLDIANDRILLSYGWSYLDVDIDSSSINTITFGTRNKPHDCFISINLKSGAKYQSVDLDDNIKFCKSKRRELQRLLNQ